MSWPTRTTVVWPAQLLGTVTAMAVVAVGTASLVAQFFQQERHTTTLVREPFDRVLVTNEVGDVTVRFGAAGLQPRLELTRTWSFAEPRVRVEVTGETLRVRARCSAGGPGTCSLDVDLTLPPEISLDLTAQTGDVEVTAPDAGVRVTSGVGDVTLREVHAPTVTVSTDVGSVWLGFAEPPKEVRAGSDTGDVDVMVPDDGTEYLVDVTTEVGEHRVEVPQRPSADRRLELSSGTGSVRVRTR